MGAFLWLNIAMDIILEVKIIVDDMELANKIFVEGLGFKGNSPAKKFCRYEMDSGCQIMVYSDFDMWREHPQHIRLKVSEEKIEKVNQILRQTDEKVFYHPKGEVVNDSDPRQYSSLDWSLKNGSILSLES